MSFLLFPEYACPAPGFHTCFLPPDPLWPKHCLTQPSKGTSSSWAGGNGMPDPHPNILLFSAASGSDQQPNSYSLSVSLFISSGGEQLGPFFPLLVLWHLEMCLAHSRPSVLVHLPCVCYSGCDVAALAQAY